MQSHFRVQPNYNVEVVLSFVVVGVVTNSTITKILVNSHTGTHFPFT